MNRLAAVLLAAGALAGLVVALAGSGDTRLFGAMGAGLCVILAFPVAQSLFTRTGAGTVLIEDIDGERGFLIPFSRAKTAISLALNVTLMVALAVAAALGAGLGWLIGAGFFAALAVYAALSLRRGRGGLGLTPTRVLAVGPRTSALPWEEVEGVDIFTVPKGGRALRVRAAAPEHAEGMDERVMGGVARRLFEDVTVAIDGFEAPPDRVFEIVNAYLGDPRRRAWIGDERELERLLR